MIDKYGVNKIRLLNSKKTKPLKISVLDYEEIIYLFGETIINYSKLWMLVNFGIISYS